MDQTTERPIRVGIVGLGFIANAHLRGYQACPNVEIVAGAEPSREQGAKMAKEYGIPDIYTDYQEMLQRTDIDAVSVCVPNWLHAPAGLAALRSGKHVLCEKPLALNSREAQEMVDAARDNGRVLQVAFNYRARGDAAALKQHIDDGGLGRIYYAKASWMRRSGIPGMGSWFTNKQMSGGGPLIDLGVHILDLSLWFMGEPLVETISASTYAEFGPRGRGGWIGSVKSGSGNSYGVEDLATAFIRLEGGQTLLLEASWATYSKAGDDFSIALYGTEGGAEIEVQNYGWEKTLRVFNDVGGIPADSVPRVPRGEGHTSIVREFVRRIETGEDQLRGGLEGLKRSKIIDACYASAAAGHELNFEEWARGNDLPPQTTQDPNAEGKE